MHSSQSADVSQSSRDNEHRIVQFTALESFSTARKRFVFGMAVMHRFSDCVDADILRQTYQNLSITVIGGNMAVPYKIFIFISEMLETLKSVAGRLVYTIAEALHKCHREREITVQKRKKRNAPAVFMVHLIVPSFDESSNIIALKLANFPWTFSAVDEIQGSNQTNVLLNGGAEDLLVMLEVVFAHLRVQNIDEINKFTAMVSGRLGSIEVKRIKEDAGPLAIDSEYARRVVGYNAQKFNQMEELYKCKIQIKSAKEYSNKFFLGITRSPECEISEEMAIHQLTEGCFFCAKMKKHYHVEKPPDTWI